MNDLNRIITDIGEILKEKTSAIVAIDGRCAAGKTTFANTLSDAFSANIIHMDDFFLQPYQRTDERLKTPGGNIDYERFYDEVLKPLLKHDAFSFRTYNCKMQALDKTIDIVPTPVTIIEGSYSCHPLFRDYYDYIIFMDIDKETQMDRITKRNGASAAAIFENKWIPLEELYLKAYPIKHNIQISTKK